MTRRIVRQQLTPTLDTGAYATGDQVSTLQTLNICDPFFGAELQTITVMDGAAQSSALDLFFFDRSVTVAADQAASSFSDAQMAFCLGVVNVLAADYDSNAANSIATVGLAPAMALYPNNKGRSVYVAIVARGSPTYAATSLVLSFNAVQESQA